jgi:RimJ/RimL family protein N-acetyltransferase
LRWKAIDLRNYLAKEILDNGTEITIRAIRPEDGTSVLEAFKGLDREAIYRRFFSPKKELTDAELRRLTDVDFANVVALVATTQTGKGETLIAGGRYAVDNPESPRSAELAFLTGEAYRGRGIAGLLLKHLKLLAEAAGLRQFEAEVLAENRPMLSVFKRSGLPMQQSREGNIIHVTLSLEAEAPI